MGQLLAIILVFTSHTVWAQSDELLKSWERTGYDIEELYAEDDFNPAHCQSGERLFSGCLMALQDLLDAIEDNPNKIEFDGASKITIVQQTPQGLPKTFDEYLERKQKKRENFNLAFQMGATGDVDGLFDTVQKLVESDAPAEKWAYAAGSAYGTFMKEAYDPRTAFTPEEEFEPKPRKFFGIGSRVEKYESSDKSLDGGISLEPMEGSPAIKAGLQKGDVILSVDGVDIRNMEINPAVDKIKGPQGTTVKLEVMSFCDQKTKTISVVRGPITEFPDWMEDSHFISLKTQKPVQQVCGQAMAVQKGEPQALYVPLTSFSAPRGKNLCDEFVQLQIKDLLNPDSKGMIFDIRGNGGGSLDAVACMLDSLISNNGGKLVGQVPVELGQIPAKAQEDVTHKFGNRGPLADDDGNLVHYNKPIIVLINGGSASASEIFAGTIQDMKRGWVIGERSVGKGSVQTYRDHKRNAQMASIKDTPILLGRTTAIYTLNSGRSPQQFGIVPDFHVDNLGEKIKNDANFVTTEAKSFGSIEFDNNKWTQTRPSEVATMEQCMGKKGTHSQSFVAEASKDERLARPFVANYQLELAKDALGCSAPRPIAVQ